MEDILKKLSQPVGAASRPAVVWFMSNEDEEENAELEDEVFCNEEVGLALRQFRTLRVNVERISHEDIRKLYERTPGFWFFDPSGETLGKLEGKRATSLRSFTRYVEKTWAKSFTTPLRSYSKPMGKILDRLDKLAQAKTRLEADRARLAEKPNARKQREADREQKLLEEEEKDIQRDEEKVLASVELRPEFLPEAGDKTAQK